MKQPPPMDVTGLDVIPHERLVPLTKRAIRGWETALDGWGSALRLLPVVFVAGGIVGFIVAVVIR